jgi:hypothetical protein
MWWQVIGRNMKERKNKTMIGQGREVASVSHPQVEISFDISLFEKQQKNQNGWSRIHGRELQSTG